ncbi:MAG: hypothetical protein M3Y54_05455 [Bacteroidota bacterium]|nr:hypothetical protein [Bacteroidota bacterium]
MANDTRTYFRLTQDQLAAWMRIPRGSIAAAERGHRSMPFKPHLRGLRLDMAAMGRAIDASGQLLPVPPPLPVPPWPLPPVQRQLRECRYRIGRLQHELEELRARTPAFEARLAAVPILRGWAGPDPNALQAEGWIDRFEQQAVSELQNGCGEGPQLLLRARIAGLEQEAAVLAQALAAAPPPPPA